MQIDKKLKILYMLQILIFIPSIFIIIYLILHCVTFNDIVAIKPDTILILLGNFAIAYYIASIINQKIKKEELVIGNSFEELDYLMKLIIELRDTLQDTNKINIDTSARYISLINLQIDLIKKYSFIEDNHIKKLKQFHSKLDKYLTEDENNINMDYKKQLLFMEKRILVIKSEILK